MCHWEGMATQECDQSAHGNRYWSRGLFVSAHFSAPVMGKCDKLGFWVVIPFYFTYHETTQKTQKELR
jgi:hypothetical protein